MDAARRDRVELARFEDSAAAIVARAGDLLSRHFRTPIALEFKDKAHTDPVTALDREIEKLVTSELHDAFPSHGVLGEEGAGELLDHELVWVLDPLDGT